MIFSVGKLSNVILKTYNILRSKNSNVFGISKKIAAAKIMVLFFATIYILLYYSNKLQNGIKTVNYHVYLQAYFAIFVMAFVFCLLNWIIIYKDFTIHKSKINYYIKENDNIYYLLYPLNKNELLFADCIDEYERKTYLIYSRNELHGKSIYKEFNSEAFQRKINQNEL